MATTTLAPTPVKVLTVGSPFGRIADLFAKAKVIDAKHGKFDILLVSGDFFGPPAEAEEVSADVKDLLDGKLQPPIPTYFTLGANPLPPVIQERATETGGMITEGLFYLGKTGVVTTSQGIKIAAFGGEYDLGKFGSTPESDEPTTPYITTHTLSSFTNLVAPPTPRASSSAPATLASARAASSASSAASAPVDILLTHAWPSSITLLSSKPLPIRPDGLPAQAWGAPPVGEALRKARPRYCFSGGEGAFWEREPFWTKVEDGEHVTRFVSLGEFGGVRKERWFYAFSITPTSSTAPTAPRPAGTTASPLSTGPTNDAAAVPRGRKRPAGLPAGFDDGPANYIFGGGYGAGAQKRGRGGGPRGGGRGGGPRREVKEIGQDECWFCLSNPKVTKHLIISIGSECYVTLPKGQVPPTPHSPSDPAPLVPGGGHVLILPIAHYPTLLSVPAELAAPVISEIERYKSALRACYASHGAALVSFEIGRLTGRGGHAHVQVCPVPAADAGRVEDAFRKEGERGGVRWEEDGEKALRELREGQNYLRVDLPDGKKLVHIMQPQPFNLQFGRQVIANLLNMPERTDWRACALSEADERADAQSFKKAFAAFDPAS